MLHEEGSWPVQSETNLPMLDPVEQRVLLGRRTILLAEDDDDLRCVVEQALKAMGYHVLACPDAESASTTFRLVHHIDILLTDFQMPGRSGIDLARELSALSPSLPVIILTGATLSPSAMGEIEAKGWMYVSKPCDLVSLRFILERPGCTRSSSAA